LGNVFIDLFGLWLGEAQMHLGVSHVQQVSLVASQPPEDGMRMSCLQACDIYIFLFCRSDSCHCVFYATVLSASIVFLGVAVCCSGDKSANLPYANSSQISTVAYRMCLPDGDPAAFQGVIDDGFALGSADRRVALVGQASIRLDSFAVYEVPVPVEFRQTPGDKNVIVTLAFDPPVRRRRAEYLGVVMDYALIRGKTLDEIIDAYRALSAAEREAARSGGPPIRPAFQNPYRCPLKPGPTLLRTSTLQKSTGKFHRENQDYGELWYLVVRARRRMNCRQPPTGPSVAGWRRRGSPGSLESTLGEHVTGDVERGRRYISRIVAVSGQGGHNTTFRAAGKLADMGSQKRTRSLRDARQERDQCNAAKSAFARPKTVVL
jgi:hypothetical protein